MDKTIGDINKNRLNYFLLPGMKLVVRQMCFLLPSINSIISTKFRLLETRPLKLDYFVALDTMYEVSKLLIFNDKSSVKRSNAQIGHREAVYNMGNIPFQL